MPAIIQELWIDESGDSGFKFERGSTRFLILTAVFLLGDDMPYLERTISGLRVRLRLRKDFEFRFSRCKDFFRTEFLKLVATLPMQYKAIVVDKHNVRAPALQFQPKQLYAEAVKRLLYDNAPPLEKAILTIDEATAKVHQKEFNHLLRLYVSKNLVGKIRQVRSHGNAMIQIADMIGGSILRKFERKDPQYYTIVKGKEKILMEF